MPRCEVAHTTRYIEGREAAFDLRRYIRIVGLPRPVRFLCEDCARGRVGPRFWDEYRIRVVR